MKTTSKKTSIFLAAILCFLLLCSCMLCIFIDSPAIAHADSNEYSYYDTYTESDSFYYDGDEYTIQDYASQPHHSIMHI